MQDANGSAPAIPTVLDGGNHTLGFTEAARSEASHNACLVVSKALAAVGMRVLTDEAFLQKVGAGVVQATAC